MSDDILDKLGRTGDRRTFLKGSAVLVAALSAGLLSSRASAQDQQAPDGKKPEPPETFIGSDGRPYRVCPVCGANMYRQDRTWTCENCGYSYEE